MTQVVPQLPLALVTGAAGGMGRAISHVLARRYRLILTDFKADSLAALAADLRFDGAAVVAEISGDIAAPATIAALAEAVRANGTLGALVHTAGISPKMGAWDRVLEINLSGTLRLLDTLEPLLAPGGSGVLIASLASHMFAGSPAIEARLRDVRADTPVGTLEDIVREAAAQSDDPVALSSAAYGLSKYGVRLLCEFRAERWGQLGCRLNSVSPGLIATPMGLMESRENPAAGALAELAPAGRWGTAYDIADGVEFLLSPAASFVSGCDLRIDGALAAKLRNS
jgi:NAD(P)-dependent dehydrogenase (short-subunit alcohol dehydrogenase family)